jgi:hypothetical protein
MWKVTVWDAICYRLCTPDHYRDRYPWILSEIHSLESLDALGGWPSLAGEKQRGFLFFSAPKFPVIFCWSIRFVSFWLPINRERKEEIDQNKQKLSGSASPILCAMFWAILSN